MESAIEKELTPLLDRTLVDIRAIFPDATEQQLTKLAGPLLRFALGVSTMTGEQSE